VEIEPPIRQSDKRAIQALLWALKPLANLRGSIPLPYAVVFLTVALEEGKTMSAYARALGIDNRRTMSRYLQDIGDRARNGGPGLGLVKVEPHPTNRNASQVLLTAKGRDLADAIIQQMRIAVAPEARRSKQRPRSLFSFALWLLRRRPRRHKRK
jgi:DNA-binding MarR family transcriptional regulator